VAVPATLEVRCGGGRGARDDDTEEAEQGEVG
jgi:hypothetical protein